MDATNDDVRNNSVFARKNSILKIEKIKDCIVVYNFQEA